MDNKFPIILIINLLAFMIIPISVSAKIYNVGPGKKNEKISEIPFDSLKPGDVVQIHYKNEPYREKFIIRRSGNKNNPIIIKGIPQDGKLPVIDGRNAYQFQKDKGKHSGRWLIKVGDGKAADYVQIKGLELRNANNANTFLRSETKQVYEDNAAGVFVLKGHHVLVSGCVIHLCGNGVITSYAPDVSHVTISGCYIHDNGNHKNPDDYLEHNVYMGGTNTLIQFSRFGTTHSDGQNIKDRGKETVIRYNWIEGGKNRQLDLVDKPEYGRADVYVYGNVIVQGREINNRNMVHWGGDTGYHRSGTLYFFNNTVIGKTPNTPFIVVRYPDCEVELKNNVFVGKGILWNKRGELRGSNNWFSNRIKTPLHLKMSLKGKLPGFVPLAGISYFPHSISLLTNRGTNKLPRNVEYMPKPYSGGIPRPVDGKIDIGAYEFFNPKVKQ